MVLLAFGCGKKDDMANDGGGGGMSQADPGETVATVNGTTISSSDVQNEVARILRQFGGNLPPESMEQMRPQLQQQAMENLVSKLVLYDAVRDAQIAVAPAEIDARFDQYRSNFPSDEIFNQQLQRMGFNEEQLRDEIGMAIQIESLLETNVGEVATPTEEECREYYDSHPEQFREPEKVKASHILVTVDANAAPEEKEAAREKIESIRQQCLAGEDFSELARTHSDCPSSAQGGDLGWFDRTRMVEPFSNAAFALQPGEISDVVETQFGYHVIRLTDHQQGREIPFEEVREQIAQKIESDARQVGVDSYIKQLREEAEVEYAQG
jgi:peptidyl-prolyl cis-trans isomerase C